MAKIPVLIALLLQLFRVLMTVFGQSPCPPKFTYYRNTSTNEVMGKIWIPFPPKDASEYDLVVEVSIGARLPSKNYVGRVQLEKSIEDTIKEIKDNKPLVYLVYFPMEQPLPRITEITLNGGYVCSGNGPSTSYMGYLVLRHTLFYHNSTHRWFDSFIGNLTSEISSNYAYGGGLEAPTDATILEVISTFSPPTGATPTTAPQTSIQLPVPGSVNDCGRNDQFVVPFIAHGDETSPGEWPWLAALFVARINLEYQCVGSILTDRHVITAAHCLRLKGYDTNLPPSSLYVALGRHRLRNWREEGAEHRYVVNYTIHPNYAYSASADSDLAILVLSSPVEFSSVIKPICLWTGPIDLQSVVNKIGYVVGWGRNELGEITLEEPRKALLPIATMTDCLFSNNHFIAFTSNRTFCAGSRDGSGPCNGDSGTGLMLYDSTSDRYYLRGIASRSLLDHSTMSCDLNNYVVFVDVAIYVDWIRGQISAN